MPRGPAIPKIRIVSPASHLRPFGFASRQRAPLDSLLDGHALNTCARLSCYYGVYDSVPVI